MYIVTGGAGFIGSAMIWKLNSLGIDDILVVDNLGSTEKWKNLVNRRYTAYMHRDAFMEAIRGGDLPAVLEAHYSCPPAQRFEGIIHMGACSSTTELDADFLMDNNLEFSKTLCCFAMDNNARFINASSAATYGDGSVGFDDDVQSLDTLKPLNMYGYSKHLFDLWARRTGVLGRIASLKFFNVYGPNEQHKGDMRSVVNKAFHQINAEGIMRLFKSNDRSFADGGQMRDFIYIKDCVQVMAWLLNTPHANGLFNVGTGKARTWNDLLTAVFRSMHLPANIQYIDMPPHLAGKYQNFTEAGMERLRRAGYSAPMWSLEDGVKDYVQRYLQQPDPYL